MLNAGWRIGIFAGIIKKMHFGAIWASKERLKVHLGLGLGRRRRTLTTKRCRIEETHTESETGNSRVGDHYRRTTNLSIICPFALFNFRLTLYSIALMSYWLNSSILLMGAHWQWENATAGAVAGFTTVAAMHPLDVVRTRFQGLIFPLWTDPKKKKRSLFFVLVWTLIWNSEWGKRVK